MTAAVQDIFIPGRLKASASPVDGVSAISVSEHNSRPLIERRARDEAVGAKEFARISSIVDQYDALEKDLAECESEQYRIQHKERSEQILAYLGEARLKGLVERAKHPGEHLKEPPANEPVLIRRVTVPPEGLFLEEAVDKVPWVNRCLNIKALNIGSVPLMVKRRQGDGTATKDDDSVPARNLLRLIERNNAHQSGNDLLESISFWMNTRQALVWMMWDDKRERTTPAEAKAKGLPDALYLLPAHRSIGMIWEGSLLYYRISGAAKAIPAWQVIRLGFYNPKEEFRCLSPLSAMFQVADTDFAMDLYNSILFESGVRLSGFISIKGSATREKMERYEQLMRKYQGVGNAHTVMVFDDDAKFQSMSGQKDMDYKNLADASKMKICTGFGVPLFMMGEPERGGRSTAQIMRRSFWQDTLLPEVRKPTDKFNVHLTPFAGDEDIFLEPDLSKVEALADDRLEFSQAFNYAAQGIAQLANAGVMISDDAADLLKARFDIEVNGQLPDDSYEEDEEIMAEPEDEGGANTETEDETKPDAPPVKPKPKPGAKPKKQLAVALGRVKNLIMRRLRLGGNWEPAPVVSVRFILIHYGGVDAIAAQKLATAISRKVRGFTRDRDEIAAYFDGLIASEAVRDKKAA